MQDWICCCTWRSSYDTDSLNIFRVRRYNLTSCNYEYRIFKPNHRMHIFLFCFVYYKLSRSGSISSKSASVVPVVLSCLCHIVQTFMSWPIYKVPFSRFWMDKPILQIVDTRNKQWHIQRYQLEDLEEASTTKSGLVACSGRSQWYNNIPKRKIGLMCWPVHIDSEKAMHSGK